jgi:heme-degrading monooxygenase HmoA
MFVRIYWGKIAPGNWDIVEKKYTSLMENDPKGMISRLVTKDVNDAQSLFTITIWQDLESLQKWEASKEYKEVFSAAIEPYLEGSHTVSLCEVKLGQMSELAPSLLQTLPKT